MGSLKEGKRHLSSCKESITSEDSNTDKCWCPPELGSV